MRSTDNVESLKEKVRIATIIGTIQSTFTDFHFLSDKWKKNTEEERLLGVSMTGVMDNLITSGRSPTHNLSAVLEELRDYATEVNAEYAEKLGISPSAAITCNKPSGTVSQLTDAASGLHTRHSPYYIRSVRIDKKDPLYALLSDQGLYMEDEAFRPDSTAVAYFPIKSPEGSITRHEQNAIEALELWLIYQRHWCHHKPSVTISVKDDEWPTVGGWVYEHFDEVSGVSFLPYDGGTYQQAPYQEVTEQERHEWVDKHPIPVVDWTQLSKYEEEDTTVSSQQYACSGGSCEIL